MSTQKKTTTTQRTGTREEWLAERLELLEAEKELTRRSDELCRRPNTELLRVYFLAALPASSLVLRSVRLPGFFWFYGLAVG